MGSLFSSPSIPQAPQEDPSIKAERDAQEQRAKEDKIRATQVQLAQETLQRNRGFGVRSLLGSYSSGGSLKSFLGAG